MDARKRNWITWAFVALTVLVVAMMLGSTLHRTTYIHNSKGGDLPCRSS